MAKHQFDFEKAVKFYMETLCNSTELRKVFGIGPNAACSVMGYGNDVMKFKKRMELLEEKVFEYNPEIEILNN